MDEPVSAADANRNFSRILREVRAGRSYVVTSHGTPVARIVPARCASAARSAAKQALMEHLRSRPVQIIGERWTRDDLYDR
jgi:prevent-host-death family protein